MQYIIKTMALCLLGIALFSCEDDHERPDLQRGVNMRVIVDANSSALSASNPSAPFAFDVYSLNKDIDSVKFLVSYYDTLTQTYSDEVVAATLRQSDFANGKAQVSLTGAQLINAIGLPVNALKPYNVFVFRTRVRLTDGRLFIDASNDTFHTMLYVDPIPTPTEEGDGDFYDTLTVRSDLSQAVFFSDPSPSEEEQERGDKIDTLNTNTAPSISTNSGYEPGIGQGASFTTIFACPVVE